MKCINCNSKTATLETRQSPQGVYRRHKCLSCGQRFTTIEILKEEYAKCVKENMFNEEINTIDCLLIVRLLNNNTFENEMDKLLAERLKKKITKKIKKELSRKQLKGGATDTNVGSKIEKGK